MKNRSVFIIAATCLIVALSALLAFSAEPPKTIAIDGPEKCEPYKLVRLAVSGEVDSAVWFIEPAEQADLAIQPGGKATVFVGPPGKYVVNLVGIKAGQLSQARKLVTIGNPPPGPGPQPQPGPDPNPQPQKLWGLIIVEDSAKRTPAEAAIYSSQPIREACKAKSLEWRLLSKGTAYQGSLATWVARAGGEVPKLFAVTADGTAAYEGKLPADEKAMLDLIGRIAQ